MTTIPTTRPLALVLLLASSGVWGQPDAQPNADNDGIATLPAVLVNGGRPSSLPVQIPTTIESINAEQLAQRINATDSEDALKYFPSLNVRKRYIGDYDHAVLSSRASGTGNSARSLVYADGILLSNLLGNGATYTPRWGLVSPEEIERVDVLYGPFSAAYPGNAVGAVVDFQTRMPRTLEAHVKLAGFTQHFAHYATDGHYPGGQGSASVGNRYGAWSWWADVSRLDSEGQPIAFATRLLTDVATVKPGDAAAQPVSGAVAGASPANKPWLVLGSSGQSHTVQDHAKLKLAYDFSPVLRLSYTLGWWGNEAERGAESYLRNSAGAAVVSGRVNINGASYDLKPSDFAPTLAKLSHLMQGVTLKQHSKGVWDWEVAASKYDYRKDLVRTPTVALASIATDGAGRSTDMSGSGWHTLSLKGVWRPDSAHVVEMGAQDDSARLRTLVTSNADWRHADGGALVTTFNGSTRLQSLYLQDAWTVTPDFKATVGARAEHWRGYDGRIGTAAAPAGVPFAARSETSWSPKGALALVLDPAWTLKASVGRAVRNPTAAELFQGTVVDGKIINSDPNLRAERSWTGELTAEHVSIDNVLRATAFHETTRDALYSQPVTALINTIQNIGKVRTSGIELAWQGEHVLMPALSVSASATYAHSVIAENAAFPASVGKRQPRVPVWRGNVLATYQAGERWSSSLGVRYSGQQFGTLDNSDPNGESYTGVSRYLVADWRLRYKFTRQWSAALGIDNLNNATYWAFHPYPQRTAVAELRFDL